MSAFSWSESKGIGVGTTAKDVVLVVPVCRVRAVHHVGSCCACSRTFDDQSGVGVQRIDRVKIMNEVCGDVLCRDKSARQTQILTSVGNV